MTRTIIGIIGSIALFSVGANGAAEYRNYNGETFQQEQNRRQQEYRLQDLERQQRQYQQRQRQQRLRQAY